MECSQTALEESAITELNHDKTPLEEYARNGNRWNNSFFTLFPCKECNGKVRFHEFLKVGEPDSDHVRYKARAIDINGDECNHRKKGVMHEAKFNVLRMHPNPIC